MNSRTEPQQTWFDWAEAHIAGHKAARSASQEDFSPSSTLLLTRSVEAARSLGCDAIGVEHLLAAFLKGGGGRVFEILGSVGFSLETLRPEIERRWGPRVPNADPLAILPYTPRCRRVVERARNRARRQGGRLVEPEDLFLELLSEREGLVAELLGRMGVSPASLREGLLSIEGT